MTEEPLSDRRQAALCGPVEDASALSHGASAARVLLVGAGRRGLTAHVPALSMISSLQLAAVVDTPSQIADLRVDPELERLLQSSLESAIASSAPDLAIVATPHDTHLPLTLQLLAARIPTLIEKPPTKNGADFLEIIDMSRSLEVPVGIFLPFRYMPNYVVFAEALCSGAFWNSEIEISADVPQIPGIGGWRRSRTRAGGGVLIDLGYHYIELLLSALGLPDAVTARFEAEFADPDEVEHTANISLRYEVRKLGVTLRLCSMPGLQKANRISLTRVGSPPVMLFEHVVPPAKPARHRDPGPSPTVRATAAQLNDFLQSGFLAGRGDWYGALLHQLDVLSLVEQLYAAAPSRITQEMTAV